MPRFFTDNISDNVAIIAGEDAKHITRVLRCKAGEKITVCDLKGNDYECEISELGEIVRLSVISVSKTITEPSVYLHLYQALPKSDKMEFIIQKAVELGVSEITPIITARCISRPDETKMKKKAERWQSIAKEAAKQSGRGIIPKVNDIVKFEQAVNKASENENAMIFYENGGERINSLIESTVKDVAVIIGSEGGFEEAEIETAKRAGVNPATLGSRILRCETAPVSAISIVMNVTENM